VTAPLLSVRGLTVRLPRGADRAHAVEDVSMDLHAGEILCVVGESGSGKSITAAAMMGLLPRGLDPVAGTIGFEGEDLLRLSPSRMRTLRGRRLGMVFQEPMSALNPVLPIGDQVEEVMRVHGVGTTAERRARTVEMLAAVGLPDPEALVDTHPHRLSGGQRQRVMIAIALMLEPAVLICDEPTTALDVTTQMQILRLVKDIQAQRGTGVMFITHDFGVVAEVAHRVVVMRHGRVVETGPARDVLDRPSHDYTKALIAAVPRLVPRAAEAAGPILLETKGIAKTFRRGGGLLRPGKIVKAVHDADFVLHRGETLGLVGESGSGKSTLARCVIRLIDPEAGEIRLDGTDLRPLGKSALHPVRKRVQMVFQDPFSSLDPRRKVGDIVAEGPRAHGTPKRAALERARELLRLVGLDPSAAARYPHEFSGGQRQRIGIARALALEPELLVADEPVSALDVSVQAQILDLLADLRARLGLTMLFITHDLRVAAQVCDRVAVMRHGAIVEQGPTGQVFGAPAHPYTRALLDAIPGRGGVPGSVAG